MKPPAKENAARGVDLGGIESDLPGGRISDKHSPATPIAQRPFVVVIRGTRRREWGRYLTFAAADDQARALQKHGFDAHVENAEAAEPPEHNGERRRFLCWALMLGAIPPERLTERIVAEVESEATV